MESNILCFKKNTNVKKKESLFDITLASVTNFMFIQALRFLGMNPTHTSEAQAGSKSNMSFCKKINQSLL